MINSIRDKVKVSTFSVGDLIKYVRVEKADAPQTWKRIGGVGIILAERSNQECENIYTILNDGESFECIEIYPITASMEVCNVHEFKDFKK
jgi:hypothetical protein